MQLFTIAKKTLDMLTIRFGNPNQKEKTRSAYKFLHQSTRESSSFWAKFQKFSQLLDHSNKTMIINLIKKFNTSIQCQLSMGKQQSTNFLELAQRYQHIKYLFKMASRNQFIQNQNTERVAWRNNGNNSLGLNNVIVYLAGSSVTLTQSNMNAITHMP